MSLRTFALVLVVALAAASCGETAGDGGGTIQPPVDATSDDGTSPYSDVGTTDTTTPPDGTAQPETTTPGDTTTVDLGPPPDTIVGPDTVVTAGGDCAPCTDDDDCGEWSFCVEYPTGTFCASVCADQGDCSSGYECSTFYTPGYTCVPVGKTCIGCLVQPCPDGKYCDPQAGICQVVTPLCGACEGDTTCGVGGRCVDGTCLPECPTEGTCPAGTSCITIEEGHGSEGADVCAPDPGMACCFGDACAQCGPCPPGKPHCDGATCVECAEDAHCGGDTPFCHPTEHVCIGCIGDADCQAPTASCHPSTHACVECLGDMDCAGQLPACSFQSFTCVGCTADYHCTDPAAPLCDMATATCVEDDPGPLCVGCPPAYQGCVEVDGMATCVPCTNDTHCESGCTCDTSRNICVGSCTEALSTCQAGGGCGSSPYFATSCDATNGYCYGSEGYCDNATAFCGPGETCVAFDDIDNLTTAPPSFPYGVGYCTCDPASAGLMCMLTPGMPGCCPSDLMCLDPANPLPGGGTIGYCLPFAMPTTP